MVEGLLIDVALDPALPAGGTSGLERTGRTVATLGDVFDRGAVMSGAGCFQFPAAGTGIEIARLVVDEFGSGELAIGRDLALIPDRDLRVNVATHQPGDRA